MNALKQNAKYLFWAGCVVVVIVGAVCWFLGTGALAKTTKQGTDYIAGIKTTINTLKGVDVLPTPKTIDDYGAQIEVAKKSVYDSWAKLYNAQQGLFKWPHVTDRFDKDIVGKKKGDEINRDAREDYWKQFAQNEIPRICKEVLDAAVEDKTETPEKGSGLGALNPNPRGAGGEAAAKPAAEEHRITWADRSLHERKLVWRNTPSSMQIWYAQEDLWILEDFCKLIAELNDGSKGAHDAHVWLIERLEFGALAKDVLTQEGHLDLPMATGGGAAAIAAAAGEAPDPAAGNAPDMSCLDRPRKNAAPAAAAGGSDAPAAPTAGGSEEDELVNGRFVNIDGDAMSAADLKNSKEEFRRMPFRLKLGMDQRRLETLLFKLRNMKWPSEIRSVRFTIPPLSVDGEARKSTRSYPCNVEICGVLYMYNSPDTNESIKPAAPAEGAKPEGEKADGTKPAEPTEGAKPAEPAADGVKPAEPAADGTKPAEPAPATPAAAKAE